MTIIEINGRKVEAQAGASIIEVADAIGIQIPRFCYHKQLSVAANCRMCLVEVEKSPKLLPACATPISEGMKIHCRSPKVLEAQKSVLEFLLMNHPLDCPICDQGGECELQDLSMGYGADFSRYEEEKRIIEDKNLGPLIQSDMTRCIHCTRCVRFGAEIAGVRELGGTGRGEHTSIGTFLERAIDSEVSANVIDLCPVGALTSKPFRYVARAWELSQKPTIAAHDCVGSPLYVHLRENQVVRVVPQIKAGTQATWISDRDRFSYEGLYTERLTGPKIKINQVWVSVSWEQALSHATQQVSKLIQEAGPNEIGALMSPNATVEEAFLFQHWIRGLGCPNIDHRLHQIDFRAEDHASLPGLGINLEEIANLSAVLLVGSNTPKEQPLIALHLRQMVAAGGDLCVINPVDFSFAMDIAHKNIVEGGQIVLGLSKVLKAIVEASRKPLPARLRALEPLLEKLVIDPADRAMAHCLLEAKASMILLGSLAQSHPDYADIGVLSEAIAAITGAKIGHLTEGSNAAGAWLMGCVPHRLPGGASIERARGLTARQMAEASLKAYILFNLELEDCVFATELKAAFEKAAFVIVMTPFESPALLEYADVLLPITPFTETAGTRINVEGQWQSFEPCHAPFADSMAGWDLLARLSKASGVPVETVSMETTCHPHEPTCHHRESAVVSGKNVEKIQRDPLSPCGRGWAEGPGEGTSSMLSPLILAAARSAVSVLASVAKQSSDNSILPGLIRATAPCNDDTFIRIAPRPLYAADGLLRRAKSLQKTRDAGKAALYLNTQVAERLGLKEGAKAWVESASGRWCLDCILDDTVPNQSVVIPLGFTETQMISLPYASLRISSAKETEDA